MHNADYAWQDVRPSVSLSSVYPSHAGIVYSFFSQSYSPTILVIPHQTGWKYSGGNPPNGGVECRGMKISRFSINIGLYLGTDAR